MKLAVLAFMATWLLCMLGMPCLMLWKQDSYFVYHLLPLHHSWVARRVLCTQETARPCGSIHELLAASFAHGFRCRSGHPFGKFAA